MGNPPSPNWGLLANPGFEGQRLKAVYFFAGNWRYHGPNGEYDPMNWYEFSLTPNYEQYTNYPSQKEHLGWSESQANRDFAVGQMLEIGTNVVVMSYWGERGNDRWVGSAPMHTSTQAHDQLFDAAVGKDLLIMPAIESSNGTLGCLYPDHQGFSQSYNFAADFPHPDHDKRLAPQLILQVKDLVKRYVTEPANPAWPAKWARMYDRDGKARLAINLIHVGSTKQGLSGAEFEAAFDLVARQVLAETGQLVGFTLDALPHQQKGDQGLVEGDCIGWQPWFTIHPEANFDPNGRVTALWRNDKHLDLFAVGADGVVRSIWYDQSVAAGYRPEGWFEIHPETRFEAKAPITALWNGETHLDLFVTDGRGVVWSIWYNDDEPVGYRPGGWFKIHPEAPLAPSSPVTALWPPGKNGKHLDLFGTTREGAVVSIWWDKDEPAGYRPDGWFAIHDETRTVGGAPIAALWKGDSHLDLFMIGFDGSAKGTWFDTDAGYRHDGWFSIGHPAARPFKPGGNLTVLWRDDRHLDFFASDGGQTVWTTWFDTHDGYRSDGWFAIRPELKTQPNAPVMASWRGPDFLELFVTDPGGQPFTITHDANDSKDHPDGYSRFGWFPLQLGTKVGRDAPIAVPRAGDGQLDLFAISPSGAVISTTRRKVDLVYLANPTPGGLDQVCAILAIQMFIPEVFDAAVTEDQIFDFKARLLKTWRLSGVPVVLDLAPGYDGHIVFLGSKIWGNNERWRLRLTGLWTDFPPNSYVGISYDTWNGYTEGYVAMPSVRNNDDDFRWIKKLFQLVS